jgi:hypothetical protein
VIYEQQLGLSVAEDQRDSSRIYNRLAINGL